MSLRLVFVTPEEPDVLPLFFGRALPRLGDETVALAVVSPVTGRSSWLREAQRFAGAFGVRDFALEAASYAGARVADATRPVVPVGRPRSVRRLAREHGLPVLEPADVNDPAFLARLRELRPDLVVSVACPQIFGAELLALPRLACLNVHSALLPVYRGMLPTFWVLAQGEERTGVTVHLMSPGIDGGDIVLQREVPIGPGDSVRSLMRTCKVVAADLVVEAVDRFRAGTVTLRPNPAGEGSYFSVPRREDVRRLRARGRALR